MTAAMTEKSKVRAGRGTVVLISLNVAVFLAITLLPEIRDVLLLSPGPDQLAGRPWTVVTASISHEMPLHILLNMALLLIFGSRLEEETTPGTLFALYLLAGTMGSLATVPVALLTGNEDLIAGASASVFGVVAAFAVLRPDTVILRSKALWWAAAVFVFNAAIVVLDPQTSEGGAAHLAGILVGSLVGLWLRRRESAPATTTR